MDQPLTSAGEALSMRFSNVTPGDYMISCMMDTIGGGWISGSGDVIALTAADVHVEVGDTAEATVVLDFAVP